MAEETTGAPSAAAPSAASSTATPAPASSTPASATVTPQSSAAPASTSVPSGEPPQERWSEILDNTRKKTRGEVETEYREKYGWVDEFHGNPYPYLEQWIDQISSHPEMGPKLLAKAARMLQSRRGQTVPAPAAAMDEPQPDIPIYDTQGRDTGKRTYSAEQGAKREQWFRQQLDASFAERFAPLEAANKRQQDAEQRAADERQSMQQAHSTLSELRQQPHFSEHEPAIKQALNEHPEWGADVHRAYAHVLTTEVIPKLSQKEQAKVLDHLQTQANGASVSPSGSNASGPPKFKNFGEAIRYFEAHPDEAQASLAKR